jgi:hypothetical protein
MIIEMDDDMLWIFKSNDVVPSVIKPQELYVIIENAFTPHIPKLV